MVSTTLSYFTQQYNLDKRQAEEKKGLLLGMINGQEMAAFQGVEALLTDEGNEYSLYIVAPDNRSFSKALNGFFQYAGTPNRVKGSHRLVDSVLAGYGKMTKWYFPQFIDGRAVVPLKKR